MWVVKMILKKKYKDGTTFTFNYDLYNSINRPKRKYEYTLDDLSHPMYARIREAYYASPWHNINVFKYKNFICKNKGITFVFDTGFVLRLNYEYTDNGKVINKYKYIQNINSVKYLKLLKLKDITIL